MMRLRAWMEIPAYVALALVCAWCANALAGPRRRLSWGLKEPTRPVASLLPALPAPPSIPAPAPAAALKPAGKADASAPRLKTVTPVPAPPPDPKAELMARFPPLVQEAQGAITGEEAAWLHAHGAVFLDARRTAMYEQGHILGAKSFSAWEDGLAEKVDQLSLFTADLKLPLVIYCSGGDCHDSHLVAQKLWLAGFRNVRIYTDGFPDWEARKKPVAIGGKP